MLLLDSIKLFKGNNLKMFTFSNDASVGAVGFVLNKLQQNPAKFKELFVQAENQKTIINQ